MDGGEDFGGCVDPGVPAEPRRGCLAVDRDWELATLTWFARPLPLARFWPSLTSPCEASTFGLDTVPALTAGEEWSEEENLGTAACLAKARGEAPLL